MQNEEIDPKDLERLSQELARPDAQLTGRDRAILIAALAVAAGAIGAAPGVAGGAAGAAGPAAVHVAAEAAEAPIAEQFSQAFIPGAVTSLYARTSVKLDP